MAAGPEILIGQYGSQLQAAPGASARRREFRPGQFLFQRRPAKRARGPTIAVWELPAVTVPVSVSGPMASLYWAPVRRRRGMCHRRNPGGRVVIYGDFVLGRLVCFHAHWPRNELVCLCPVQDHIIRFIAGTEFNSFAVQLAVEGAQGVKRTLRLQRAGGVGLQVAVAVERDN